MNPEIWGRLNRQGRSKDLKFSALQTTLTKVGNITTQTTDMLLKSRAQGIQLDVESIMRMNTDALALLGHISFEISQGRCDVIRPTLNKDYSMLRDSHVQITTMLFGDELQMQLNRLHFFKIFFIFFYSQNNKEWSTILSLVFRTTLSVQLFHDTRYN